MKITILDGYTINPGDNPWTQVKELGECTIYDRTPPELVIERAQEADILLTSKVKLTEAVIMALPKLRYISLLATGYNNVDTIAAARRGIPVANVPAYSTESVVQTVFGLILELASGICIHSVAVRNGEWASSPDHSFWKQPIVELNSLTIGIVGYGTIGMAVARVASAFGMRVIAFTPRIPADPGPVLVNFVSLEELFGTADVISLNCPQTPENTGFVNNSLLALMKPTAFLINAARGGLINEQDLADALNRGVIAGAGLDVVAVEPMLADNPLQGAANCVITPHIAWASLAARKRLMAIIVNNITSFIAGSPVNVVTPPLKSG